MTYPHYTIEVRMLRDTWVEFVPEVNEDILGYDDMRFKERAQAHINAYNEANEFPKEIVSYVAKSSFTGKKTELDDFYGLCIDPDGDVWKVSFGDHKCVIGWDYDCDEWVLTVNPRGRDTPWMSIRLNPRSVSKKALLRAIRVVKRSDAKRFLIETITTCTIYKDCKNARDFGFTKAEAIKRLAVVDTLDIGSSGIDSY